MVVCTIPELLWLVGTTIPLEEGCTIPELLCPVVPGVDSTPDELWLDETIPEDEDLVDPCPEPSPLTLELELEPPALFVVLCALPDVGCTLLRVVVCETLEDGDLVDP